MKILYNFILVLFLGLSYNSLAQQWQWASSFGNSNNDNSSTMTVDASGNIFVAGGYFNASLTIGSNILSNSGGGDLYIAKYSPSGTVLWAQSINGSGAEFMGSISTGTNGNVYVCGKFDSPTLNVGGYTLTRSGTLSNIFVACYSNAGAALWAYRYGNGTSPYSASANSCAYSPSENCLYVTGSFTGTLSIGTTTLTNSTTNNDMFLAKFSIASFSAAPVWALKTGGSTAGDNGISVKVDNSANVFVGGTFAPVTGSTSTIGVAVTSQGGQDNFIAKYNSSGTFQWVRTFGTNTGNEGLNNIALDASSNIYACGYYNAANLVFPTASYTLNNIGVNDGYFTKFNSSGTFQWANRIGGVSASDYITGISTDASNNVYITGSYASSLTTIGTSTYTVPSSGSSNVFVAKFSSSNVFQWALSSQGTASVSGYARAIVNDNSGNVYSSGTFYSYTPITFNTSTLTSNGQNDVYISKISCITPTITASNVNYTVCPGSVNSFTPYINSPQSDVTYSWSVNGASGINLSSTTGTSTSISYTGSTSFSIVVTGTNACSNVTATVGSVQINPLPSVTANCSPTLICDGSPAVLSGGGASTYTWSPTMPNGMPMLHFIGEPTYTVTGTDVNGCINSATINLNIVPNPTISINGENLVCLNKPNILIANGASTYTWLPGSIVNSTINAQPSTNTVYTVNAQDMNGCAGSNTFSLSLVTPVTPSICLVSVDSVSYNNFIVWDKTLYNNVDSFIVYREVSTNVYKRIGAQHKSALSLFTDTARHTGPANGNPNITSYRYKLQLRDTCGNYSALSPYHNSIYFISNTTGNYFWNIYDVEGQTTPVTTFDLYRDNNATGTWTLVGSTAGTQTTLNDPNYASYPNAIWKVEANGFNCTATAKTNQQVNKSKSNIKNNFNIPLGITPINLSDNINLAPNPANINVTVTFNAEIYEKTNLFITDVLGNMIAKYEVSDGKMILIPVNDLTSGIYFIKIQQGKNTTVKKFIKE